MKGEQLARQLMLLKHLSTEPSGLTIADITDKTHVSQRTAYRDLAALQAAGFPLQAEKQDGRTKWKFMDHVTLALPRPLRLPELIALYLGRTLLENNRATAFQGALVELIRELAAVLPPRTRTYLNGIQETFRTAPDPCRAYSHFNEVAGQINQAVTQGRTVEMIYQTMKEKKGRRLNVDPYHVWFRNGTIYIIGYCHARGAERIFALDRIRRPKLTDHRFTVPDHFDFEHFVGHHFGATRGEIHTVTIRISPARAGYIGDRTWHASQTVQPHIDGGIDITFRVAGLSEIRQWVLALGPHAQVLEPEELCNQIRNDLAAALARYPSAPYEPEEPLATTVCDPQQQLWG
jgi:predicted DNA-binding transcriptional regulator YafY